MNLPAILKCGMGNAERGIFRSPAGCLARIPHSAFDWLPDLDSHQDKRLNRPPCYFDTIWQKLVCAAGIAPAVPWFQARNVAATPRAGRPGDSRKAGDLFCRDGSRTPWSPGSIVGLGGLEGSCTLSLPADNGSLSLIELRVQMVGSAGKTPVVASGMLDDAQVKAGYPGHFPKLVAGMGVTPI